MTGPSSSLLQELASIKAFIGTARVLMKDGTMPDIRALEQRITDVCLGIQAADANEQCHCLPELASLLKSLDACEQDIRAWGESQKTVAKL